MNNERKKVLITNLLIEEDICDSFCKYCYYRDKKKSIDVYRYDGKLKLKIDQIVKFATTYFSSPIIKICGGEIFLMSNIKELVIELLKYYPYVLIQTNGRHLNNDNLKWIIDLKRVLIQISLDGHDLNMNTYRFEDGRILEKLLHAVKILKRNNVYLELTCVLNNKNTKRFIEFLRYLKSLPSGKRSNTLKVTPILIIDKDNLFKPALQDLNTIDQVVMDYDEFSDVLPPKKYMEMLNIALHGGIVKYQCFNPIVSLNLIDNGKVKSCTNVLPEDILNIGEIFTDKPEVILERFGDTKFQKLLLYTKQWVPICKNCFNFCSIYNLYLNNTISLDELCNNNYMFNLNEVKKRLEELHSMIDVAKIRI